MSTKQRDQQILQIVCAYPKISIMQLCRLLNNKYKFYCNRKKCFANPRKRKHFTTFKPDCKTTYSMTRHSLTNLQRQQLITIHRMKKADGKEPRGWDYFQCCYPANYPITTGKQETLQ